MTAKQNNNKIIRSFWKLFFISFMNIKIGRVSFYVCTWTVWRAQEICFFYIKEMKRKTYNAPMRIHTEISNIKMLNF